MTTLLQIYCRIFQCKNFENRLRFDRIIAMSLVCSFWPTQTVENSLKTIYTVSQKTRHQTLGHNFTNYYPIFKIFSLADSAVNLQQIPV